MSSSCRRNQQSGSKAKQAGLSSLSRRKSKLPTHVRIRGIRRLDKSSMVLLEQIRTIDKKRLGDYIGRVNHRQMLKVDEALRISIEV